MNDYLLSATDVSGNVRVLICYTKEMVENARKIHDTTPTASAALGRTLTMVSMMCYTLKGEKDLITVNIKGDGPVRNILAVGNSKLEIKGTIANPNVDVPFHENGKLNVKAAIGSGSLSVIKDLGLKAPYSGTIELVSGEIAEDFTYYFAVSEQTPSSVGLGVLVDTDGSIKHAGGFFLSLLPDADIQIVGRLEKNLEQLSSITTLFNQGETCEDILKQLFKEIDYKILDQREVSYHCNCSLERVATALASLSAKDLQEIIQNNQKVEVSCQFCNKKYLIDGDKLKEIGGLE